MPYDEEVLKFLEQTDNLRIALEVEEYLPRVKDRIQRLFWERSQSWLANKLRETGFVESGWTLTPLRWEINSLTVSIGIEWDRAR
jgi:hypothetical protein